MLDEEHDTGWFGGGSSTSSSDDKDAGHQFEIPYRAWPRRAAISAQAVGRWNPDTSSCFPEIEKPDADCARIKQAVRSSLLCEHLEEEYLDKIAKAFQVKKVSSGSLITRYGGTADSDGAFVVALLDGTAETYHEDDSSSNGGTGSSGRTMMLDGAYHPGTLLAEMSVLTVSPCARSVYAKGECTVALCPGVEFMALLRSVSRLRRQDRESCLRQVKLLAMVSEGQLARLAEVIGYRMFKAGSVILRQGDPGDECYFVKSGTCVASVAEGVDGFDVMEHRVYKAGDVFGELVLLRRRTYRAATIVAKEDSEVLVLQRGVASRLLGALPALLEVTYMTDPRKIIADFWKPGGPQGPLGMSALMGEENDKKRSTLAMQHVWARGEAWDNHGSTQWFAVYRPTSRDAISKMLNGVAVGKGMNVKGKSAKRNHLSGFVPFMQISDNAHKVDLEPPDENASVMVYYQGVTNRDIALYSLAGTLRGHAELAGKVTFRDLKLLDDYEHDDLFGIDIPELVLRKAYIDDRDITFVKGYDTGRESSPAFMDLNMHALREVSSPKVVLVSWDLDDPMNPHALLMAYAEGHVKPVVSDFDTFTVGSKNMQYGRLPHEQEKLVAWTLQQAYRILQTPSSEPWSMRWFKVFQHVLDEHLLDGMPEYGWGDPTSCRITEACTLATLTCGAVRHGPECFNYTFPQDLDEVDYLVVWEKFKPAKGVPWDYLTEPQLRKFLMERVEEGWIFPIHPVWAVRDKGWYKLFQALVDRNREAMEHWYPDSEGIMAKIEQIHKEFPNGFTEDASEDDVMGARATDLEGDEQMNLTLGRAKVLKLKAAVSMMRPQTAAKSLRRVVNTVIHARRSIDRMRSPAGETGASPHPD